MKKIITALAAFFSLSAVVATGVAADSVTNSMVGAQGYDLVSYHTKSGPLRGNGHNVVEHKGVTYVFATAENKKIFAMNPAKYLPAYGGYCAMGVALEKKLVADPTVWEIVDGRLYLNLDTNVQGMWSGDIPGNIEKADGIWTDIKNTPAGEL